METLTTIPAAIAALIPAEQLKDTKKYLLEYTETITRLEALLLKCPNIYDTRAMKKHPAIFHYFFDNSDIFVCEYDRKNLLYGYSIINGDLLNSEWGYFNLSELTKIKVLNIDYHFEEQTIETALYRAYPHYFKKPFLLEEDTVLNKNDPLPDVYIKKPYKYNRTKHGTILYLDNEERFLQGEDETQFFRDCNRAKQHNRSLTVVIDEYFIN